MPFNTYHLNLREGEEPLIICPTDKSGEVIPDPKSISLVCLANTGREGQIQVNYSGPYKVLSFDALRNPKFSRLEQAVYELGTSSKVTKQSIDAINRGYPLVLFRNDENGNPMYDKVFSLLSFGRNLNPDSDEKLKVDYIGNLLVVPYTVAERSSYEVYERLTKAYDFLKNILKKRIKKKPQKLKEKNKSKNYPQIRKFPGDDSEEIKRAA